MFKYGVSEVLPKFKLSNGKREREIGEEMSEKGN